VSERFPERLTRKIQPEADLLFSTARVRMTAEMADRIRATVRKEVNWIYLIKLALRHETTALLYWNLQRICPESVPASVLEPLAARYQAGAAEARQRAEELVRILGALKDRGIFALAYKGLILGQRLYGSLSLREFSESSDLDILVRQCDLAKAQDVVLSQGYREYARTQDELMFCRKHGGARLLELHWRFMLQSARVQGDPERMLKRFETVPLAGATVQSLPLEVYFLVLCLHATKHKWAELKLICDIAEILGSNDVDWNYVVREAEDLGLKRMLAVGVFLAEDPLEVEAPARLKRRLKIDRVARALAEECRQGLLQEPDETTGNHDLRFLFKVRERLHDRTSIFLWEWLWPKTMPDERDRSFAPIPASLSALYYFVRPMRLAWEKISERP
jgi:hypothetical protein